MSKKIIQEQIMTLLEDIANQTNIVNNYKEQIPQIELDIIMSNIRKLYVAYQKINTINFSSPLKEENLSEMLKEEPPQTIQTPQKEEIKASEIKKEENFVEKEIEETPSLLQQEQTSLFEEEKTIGDQFQEKKQEASINDSIKKEKEDVSIGSKMQQNAITDIGTVIGLNEKFLFINELFKGNQNAFNLHVEKLNNCENATQANSYLENLSQEYNWTVENTAKEKFYKIVERKFL